MNLLKNVNAYLKFFQCVTFPENIPHVQARDIRIRIVHVQARDIRIRIVEILVLTISVRSAYGCNTSFSKFKAYIKIK